jgi:hypothetical protein
MSAGLRMSGGTHKVLRLCCHHQPYAHNTVATIMLSIMLHWTLAITHVGRLMSRTSVDKCLIAWILPQATQNHCVAGDKSSTQAFVKA